MSFRFVTGLGGDFSMEGSLDPNASPVKMVT